MKIEQLNSLNDDELAMLWAFVNKVNPPVIEGMELDYKLFTAIKHKKLLERVMQCKQYIKNEYHKVFDDMIAKIQ
jgi:hypothetical protein